MFYAGEGVYKVPCNTRNLVVHQFGLSITVLSPFMEKSMHDYNMLNTEVMKVSSISLYNGSISMRKHTSKAFSVQIKKN